MFLIMSAAYVDQELSSEFGLIPPSLLPLGNRRLFQHQLTNIPSGVEAFLSLPESYKIRDIDEKWLTENSINILRTPDGLSLGASLVAALNLTEKPLNSPLHVLFGDTLINPLPTGDDIVAVSDIENIYNWAFVTNDGRYWLEDSQTKNNVDSNNVVSGYFKFSEPRQLIKAITQSHWNFIEGLNKYHKNIG
ncbi:capsular biosynthesis protein, partial (plasmid) [Escherichia coli]